MNSNAGRPRGPTRGRAIEALRPALRRSLSSRNIQFIAVGGAIGSGLFYGSANTIGPAGPAVLFGYIIGGGIIFVVMRALGFAPVGIRSGRTSSKSSFHTLACTEAVSVTTPSMSKMIAA